MPWKPFDTAPKFPKKDDKGPLILVYGVQAPGGQAIIKKAEQDKGKAKK